MQRFQSLLAISIAAAALASCDALLDAKCEAMRFDELAKQQISSVKVYNNLKDSGEARTIAVIEDNEKITALKSFLSSRNKNWRALWAGVPVGRLRVVFWNGEDRVSHFAIGDSFIEAHGCGYFFIKDLSRSELQELLALLGVSLDQE